MRKANLCKSLGTVKKGLWNQCGAHASGVNPSTCRFFVQDPTEQKEFACLRCKVTKRHSRGVCKSSEAIQDLNAAILKKAGVKLLAPSNKKPGRPTAKKMTKPTKSAKKRPGRPPKVVTTKRGRKPKNDRSGNAS